MLGLASEPAVLLAERLMKIVPPGLAKVFYSDSGATATEVAFKLAAQYWHNVGRPEKTEFVGFAEAYHGDTVGAMSVGRMPAFHKPYFPMLFKVHFAPTPYVYRFLGKTSDPSEDPDSRGREPRGPRFPLAGFRPRLSRTGRPVPRGLGEGQCLDTLETILREHGRASPPSASSRWCRARVG